MNTPVILIAEDDNFIIDIYSTKLIKEGFEVTLARNGKEAILVLEKNEKMPDLILLDIMMPEMNGFDFLMECKKNLKYRNIPVVVLSNAGDPEEIQKALSLGAKDYLVKSYFTPDEVLQKIKTFIQ